ncbi:thiol reductant ABC exporter subunit CydC [Salimicrobium halophilum]|uniref:ATP-binding cassette, subfamily C, CydC n=1 Tax=Salimicrobium halophilum TaxID=86666 RepID=A0A1G8WRK7_9BACI|nr:thiol reductant ABC exporter subunit CydC [Salimicrobium halophilum]SDJ80716.1 ATP-binding cassette, subfamily C, CydC [Salimicrobium halophilum]
MKELTTVVKLVAKERRDIWLSIFFGVLAGLTTVGLFGASGYLISKAALTPPLYTLIIVIAMVKLFGFIRGLGRYAERLFSHRATFTILSHIRTRFFDVLEPRVPQIFQKYRSGDLLSRVIGDVESLQNFFLRVYYPPIVLVIVFLSTILFTAFFSWMLALIFFLGLIMVSVIIPLFMASRQRKSQQSVREGRGELSVALTEWMYGFRDLKIYQRLKKQEEELASSMNEHEKQQERQQLQIVHGQSLNTFVALTATWVVTAASVWLVQAGDMDGLFLAMFIMISLMVFEDAGPMATVPVYLEDNRHAAERLFSLEEESSPRTVEPLETDAPLSFAMERVTYSFPEAPAPVLRDISLSIPAGSKTAIIGASGSGKSTVSQLLLAMDEAQDGRVSVNGKDIVGVEQGSLWDRVNVILQENHFFYGTIKDNLAIADDTATGEAMNEVLEKVQLAHFSPEDRVEERGDNLSGGEKQRLALARAYLKQSHTWLLDEPFSSVDALTQAELSEDFWKVAAEDTVVLISHNLKGLERMDQIIVMDHGELVEAGNYDELMEKKGHFYELKQVEREIVG